MRRRQAGEHRRDEMQAVERAIGGVAAEIVPAPTSAGRPRPRPPATWHSSSQGPVEARAGPARRAELLVDKCRKQGPDRHSVIIGEARASCYGFACSPTGRSKTYRRDGYLVIPRLIQGEQLAELRALTDRIVAEARGVAANDELYDLEPSHSASAAAGAPAEARDLQALRLLPCAGARAQDHVDPGAAPRARRSACMAASST